MRALEANTKNPSRTARKPLPPRASSASAGPIPRSAKTRPAERDRSAASLGSEHQKPIAHSAKAPSSPELPQRAQDRSRGAPNTPSGAGSVRSEPWKRSPKPLAHSAKAPSSPELPQRAQGRSRGAPTRTGTPQKEAPGPEVGISQARLAAKRLINRTPTTTATPSSNRPLNWESRLKAKGEIESRCRETPHPSNENHSKAPAATPTTKDCLQSQVSVSHSLESSIAVTVIHSSRIPGLPNTRTNPVQNPVCG